MENVVDSLGLALPHVFQPLSRYICVGRSKRAVWEERACIVAASSGSRKHE